MRHKNRLAALADVLKGKSGLDPFPCRQEMCEEIWALSNCPVDGITLSSMLVFHVKRFLTQAPNTSFFQSRTFNIHR
jgi:hypothetical protein